MIKIINESMHRKGDRVKINFWADPHDGEVGTVTGSLGEVCWVKLDSGEVVKVVNAFLDDYDSAIKEEVIQETSRYISREKLMDKVSSMYMDYPIWHPEMDEILVRNGASEDDSSPEGFMKGMTVRQLRQVIKEFKDLIRRKDSMYESAVRESKIADKIRSSQDEKEMTKRAIRTLKNAGGEYKDLAKEFKDHYGEDPLEESDSELKYFALIEDETDTVISVGKYKSKEDAEKYFAPALNSSRTTCQEISKEEYDVYKNNFDDQSDLGESYDDDEYSDFDDDTVKPDKSFDYEGFDYVWVERHGDVQHLDFDNWAVWEAWCLDTDESLFFVVDEDTGFIDWGPCETVEIACDFLDSKVEDWENDL